MFARPSDMEPGFWFRSHVGGDAMQFVRFEPIVSRFAGKDRVRVVVARPGRSFVADAGRRFPLVDRGRDVVGR
jgi:hypothetical protein